MMWPSSEPRGAAYLASVADEGLGMASVTVWKILDGIGRRALGQRRVDLARRFRNLLDDLFEDRVVDWSLADAHVCARIIEAKRWRGERLDDHVPDAFSLGRRLAGGWWL